MIVFVTTRFYERTVRIFVENKRLKLDAPPAAVWSYDQLFRADQVPAATFILTDLERLYPWEARLAGRMFRSLKLAGLRCLNDPARVLTRFRLLRALYRAGINPFDVYRADDNPMPRRFPVFIRAEQEHEHPIGGLLKSQRELDAELARLTAKGVPLFGLLVIEFCGEPFAPGIWRKFGTFRIGHRLHVNQHVTQDNWMVKHGTKGLCPDWLYVVENETVVQNRYPPAVAEAFRISGIEYGRADHGLFEGRDVVFEINTNPNISTRRQESPIRQRTMAHSRAVLARDLWQIDSGDGSPVSIPAAKQLVFFRQKAGPNLSGWRP